MRFLTEFYHMDRFSMQNDISAFECELVILGPNEPSEKLILTITEVGASVCVY